VWLYFRFTVSFRDVEEILAYRGVFVTYEAIRQWTLKFGQTYANALRRRQLKRALCSAVMLMNFLITCLAWRSSIKPPTGKPRQSAGSTCGLNTAET
jgi:hypothetical protein